MSKRDSDKPEGPPPTPDPTIQVTESQVIAPPRTKRRSTTQGVGWYAMEDASEIRRAPRVRIGRVLLVTVLLAFVLGGAAAGYLWWLDREVLPAAPVVIAPAPPPPADAAPIPTVRLTLRSKPPGAEFLIDGKPAGTDPTQLDVAPQSKLDVQATLPGHQPWHEQVVVGPRGKLLTARLTPEVPDAGVKFDAAPPLPPPPPKAKATTSKAKKAAIKKKKTPVKKNKATPRRR